MGLDPAGNKLGVAMPRYAMSSEDMQALIAYIQRLGNEPEAGIRDDAITLGSLLPLDGPSAEAHRARRAALEACVADLNARGGFYNRRIELAFVEAGRGAGALGHLFKQREIFALVGGSIAGSESAVDALLLEHGIPAVAPFTLEPQLFFPANHNLFYLYAGLQDLSRAMVQLVAGEVASGRPRSAILHRADSYTAGLASDLAQHALNLGWPEPLRIDIESIAELEGLSLGLREAGIETLFFFTNGEQARRVLAAAASQEWSPLALGPGSLVGAGLAAESARGTGEILLAFPTLPVDRDSAALAEYRRLASEYQLPKRYLGAQLESIAAMKIMAEGLRRAGRGLSRAGLIAALEELYDFPTGLTPPVTYGPGQRRGARGAYLLPFSLATAAPSGPPRWIELAD
jgi:ABC-type branched-subunit amino acid transport system substrate-binding protein